MNREVLLRIEDYLKKNGSADINVEKSKMQLRAEGKTFSTEEHLQGLIYSFVNVNIKMYKKWKIKMYIYPCYASAS